MYEPAYVTRSFIETRRVEKTDRRYDFGTELEPGIKYRYKFNASFIK